MSKILVVFGATGQQGGSVIDFVRHDPELSEVYHIRAVTRDPSKPAARSLKHDGLEIVEGDIDDKSSLQNVMQDAHTVFAMTESIHDSEMRSRELRRGKDVVDIAVASGVQFFIYSTLPSISRISGGKYQQADHFDVKAEVEEYIRSQSIKSAFVAPGVFMQIFQDFMAPISIGNGKYALSNIVTPQTQLPLLDAAIDTGKFVAAILTHPEMYEGKVVPAATKLYSMQDVARIMSAASGKPIEYNQIPPAELKKFLPPALGVRVVDMLLYVQDFGYFGQKTTVLVEQSSEVARAKLVTLETFVEKNGVNVK